jgi:hypothetical protein
LHAQFLITTFRVFPIVHEVTSVRMRAQLLPSQSCISLSGAPTHRSVPDRAASHVVQSPTLTPPATSSVVWGVVVLTPTSPELLIWSTATLGAIWLL